MFNSRTKRKRKSIIEQLECNIKSIPPYKRLRRISNWSNWISASATRNYMLRDPLIDWLKLYGQKTLQNSSLKEEAAKTFLREEKSTTNYQFIPFIKNQGINFEERLIALLYKKLGTDAIIDIGGSRETCRTESYVKNTFDAMKKGIAVIYSGVLWNPRNNTYGIPDLLIRSDVFDTIVSIDPIPEEEKSRRAPLICKRSRYHYRVVDIKFSTLCLRADGIHLLNQGSFPAYKSQLYIYNQALGVMQGYTPSCAYILGTKHKYSSRNVNYSGRNCLSRLGVVDFTGVDEQYISLTKSAIRWLSELRHRGHRWNPIRSGNKAELYPNMCNTKDYPFHGLKQAIAEEISEITSVWMLGTKNRRIAFSKSISKWTDPMCTAAAVGVNGRKIAPIVDKMLQINRNPSSPLVSPSKIETTMYEWNIKPVIELYIDFESVNDVITDFNQLPYAQDTSMIFMIGAGYEDPNTRLWKYKSFIAKKLEREEEKDMCDEFICYVKEIQKKWLGTRDIKLFHWAPAEKILWNQASSRHDISQPWMYVDMLDVFKAEPIIVKGCLNFSIKTIATQMYKLGLIPVKWIEDERGDCMNGANAMVAALIASKTAKERGIDIIDTAPMKEIITYNETDCRVLYEIVRYLRICHI